MESDEIITFQAKDSENSEDNKVTISSEKIDSYIKTIENFRTLIPAFLKKEKVLKDIYDNLSGDINKDLEHLKSLLDQYQNDKGITSGIEMILDVLKGKIK